MRGFLPLCDTCYVLRDMHHDIGRVTGHVIRERPCNVAYNMQHERQLFYRVGCKRAPRARAASLTCNRQRHSSGKTAFLSSGFISAFKARQSTNVQSARPSARQSRADQAATRTLCGVAAIKSVAARLLELTFDSGLSVFQIKPRSRT